MTERIYLDHAATTPIRAEVREAMMPFLSTEAFGNPSSLHVDGQRAKRALDSARATLAQALGVQFSEVTFMSGGTEADNAALVGVMLANRGRDNRVVTATNEHEAVLHSCRFLESLGIEVVYVAPDEDGFVSPDRIADAVDERTVLVSVMHANNEVGTIQPVREIAEIAHAAGAWLHTDAVQTFGLLPVNAVDLGADLISVSSHKIYGPKGVGALYVREGIPIEPLLHGGAQERERRAGTENVAGIAGFAKAVDLSTAERAQICARLIPLRDRLIDRLLAIDGAVLNGHRALRLPGNVNISFPWLHAEELLLALDLAGVSASSGSACTSGSIEPSHVLLAMGLGDDRARSALRFTLGRETTVDEIDRAAAIVERIVEGQRRSSILI